MPRRVAPLVPSTEELLQGLGERLRLARLRRGLSAKQVAARAGMAPMTLRSLERGGSGATMGAYLALMQVLGLEQDLNLVAQSDRLGRSLQDARLSSHRRPKRHSASISSTGHQRPPGQKGLQTLPGQTQDSRVPPVTTLIKSLPLDQARNALDNLPDVQLRSALSTLPSEQLREFAEASTRAVKDFNPVQENLRKMIDSLPAEQLHKALKFLSSKQVQTALASISSEQLRNVINSQSRAVEQFRKPLEDAKDWLDSSFASSKALANLIDTPTEQKGKRR